VETAVVKAGTLNITPTGKETRHRDGHRPVSFLTEQEIYALADAAATMRHGQRNCLLIYLMFQSSLRVSEALDLRLRDKQVREGSHLLVVEHGKGNKPRLCGIPESLYLRIGNYASEAGITRLEDKLFDITRVRAWQILQIAAMKAGLDHKRVYNHLLRHSGAVQRLRRHGDIGSLRVFLGHSSTEMSLRYLSTVQQIESVAVESGVTFDR
jgi:type 1 fimbriae regulatory protein FimB